MIIEPLAGPCSAMPACFTTSTYQPGKSSDCFGSLLFAMPLVSQLLAFGGASLRLAEREARNPPFGRASCQQVSLSRSSVTDDLDHDRALRRLSQLDQQDALPHSESQSSVHRRQDYGGCSKDARAGLVPVGAQPGDRSFDVLEQTRLPFVDQQRARRIGGEHRYVAVGDTRFIESLLDVLGEINEGGRRLGHGRTLHLMGSHDRQGLLCPGAGTARLRQIMHRTLPLWATRLRLFCAVRPGPLRGLFHSTEPQSADNPADTMCNS